MKRPPASASLASPLSATDLLRIRDLVRAAALALCARPHDFSTWALTEAFLGLACRLEVVARDVELYEAGRHRALERVSRRVSRRVANEKESP